MVPRVVCFDVGGVLLGAERSGICGRITSALGVSTDEVRSELNEHFLTTTKPLREAVVDFSDDLNVDPATVANAIGPLGTDTCYVYDDAVPVLERIYEQTRVVAVSNTNPWERIPIADTPLQPYVDASVTSFDVGVAKPKREIFEAALEAVEIPPDETDVVMVGDSDVDIQGADQLDWRTVHLHRDYDVPIEVGQPPPDYVISDLTELVQYL